MNDTIMRLSCNLKSSLEPNYVFWCCLLIHFNFMFDSEKNKNRILMIKFLKQIKSVIVGYHQLHFVVSGILTEFSLFSLVTYPGKIQGISE